MGPVSRLKEECELSADIVRVVGQYVELAQKGTEYKGLCPFHDDHKPSMCVVPKKQMFHCFSCGAGGDQFEFIKMFQGVGFKEAVEQVARILGVTKGKAPEAADDQKREKRQSQQIKAKQLSRREILDEWKWYQEHAFDSEPWAKKLGVDPRAMAIAKIVAAPYRGNQQRAVLVAPMRDAEGVLCSLRFRDFESKRRWSLEGTSAGLLTPEETFDPDVCLDGVMDITIEGETDLLGALTIMLRSYGEDVVDWPARWIGLPGVMACHDLLLGLRHASVTVTLFDLDGAGFRAAFDHRPMKMVTDEDGKKRHEVNLEADIKPGLIRRLQDQKLQARACFPPRGPAGVKYDIRDMAKDGWHWDRLRDHLLSNCTADPRGVRIRRLAAT